VETQLREKPLWGSQTQDIHYSEDKMISVECLHSKPLNLHMLNPSLCC
jgi:hypothetical protein